MKLNKKIVTVCVNIHGWFGSLLYKYRSAGLQNRSDTRSTSLVCTSRLYLVHLLIYLNKIVGVIPDPLPVHYRSLAFIYILLKRISK